MSRIISGLPWELLSCGRHGLDPWSWKIRRALGQISPSASTTEAHEPRARAPQQEKPPQWKAHVLQLESSPHMPQLEKNLHSNQDLAQLKIR